MKTAQGIFNTFNRLLMHILPIIVLGVLKLPIAGAAEDPQQPNHWCLGKPNIICDGPGVSGGGNGFDSILNRVKNLLESSKENGLKANLKRFLERAKENLINQKSSVLNRELLADTEQKIDLVLTDISAEYSTDLESQNCQKLRTANFHFYKAYNHFDIEAITQIGQKESLICFNAKVIAENLIKEVGSLELIQSEEVIMLHLITLALHEHRHHFQSLTAILEPKVEESIKSLETDAQSFAFLVMSLSVGNEAENPTYIIDQSAEELIAKYKDTYWTLLENQQRRKIIAEVSHVLKKLNNDLKGELIKAHSKELKAENAQVVAVILASIVAIATLAIALFGIVVMPEILFCLLLYGSIGVAFGSIYWKETQIRRAYSVVNKVDNLIGEIDSIGYKAAGNQPIINKH